MDSFRRKVLLLIAVFTVMLVFILYTEQAQAATKPSEKVKVEKVYTKGETEKYKAASRGTPAPIGTADVSSVVSYAKRYLGVKYIYGASGPEAFDCSGLTMHVMGKFGIYLPHTARGQSAYGVEVPMSDLKPGDLVYFATSGGSRISHVGIYVGNDSFIHASLEGVIISSLYEKYYSRRYVTARRLFNDG